MLPRLLHLALTSNSGNKEADLAAAAELKAHVLQCSRSLGVCAEDLGLWLSKQASASDNQVLTNIFYSVATFIFIILTRLYSRIYRCRDHVEVTM